MDYRIEKDVMGEIKVPANSYYGAFTARAQENFRISGVRAHKELIEKIKGVQSYKKFMENL